MKKTNKRVAYKKTLKVIDSCKTFWQLESAMNLVHHFGKLYGFGTYWLKLGIHSLDVYKTLYDEYIYRQRLIGK
ncbi:MAG: hypothetical protein U9Q40_03160 [Campylobacterota bacterium]|nr:hypothetical protein [Campylobacterota bacterium]